MAQGRLQHGRTEGAKHTWRITLPGPCEQPIAELAFEFALDDEIQPRRGCFPIRHRIGAKAGGSGRSQKRELPSLEDHRSLQRQRQCQHVMRQRHEPVDALSDRARRLRATPPEDRARQYGNQSAERPGTSGTLVAPASSIADPAPAASLRQPPRRAAGHGRCRRCPWHIHRTRRRPDGGPPQEWSPRAALRRRAARFSFRR